MEYASFWSRYKGNLGQRLWLFIFLLLLLFIQSSFVRIFWDESGYTIVQGYRCLRSALITSGICYLLLSFVRSVGWYRCLSALTVGLFSVLFLIETFTLFNYNLVFEPSSFILLFASNANETLEFFANLQNQVFWKTLLPFFSVATLSYLIYLWGKRFRKNVHCERKGKRNIILLWVLLLISTVSYYNSLFKKLDKVIQNIELQQSKTLTLSRFDPEHLSSIDRLLFSYWVYMKQNRQLQLLKEMVFTNRVPVKYTPRFKEPLNVILILGESLRGDFMHCNGYSLPNTPRLDSLISKGNLYLIPDAVSPKAHTLPAMQEIFSLRTANDSTYWMKAPLLVDLMKQAGFHTYWLSRQEVFGPYAIVGVILSDMSDDKKYVTAGFDEALLPELKFASQLNDNLFSVIHLMGNHIQYHKKFPASYKHFTLKDLPRDYGEKKGQNALDYINSIYYNDYVVSSIMKAYEEEEAIVIYLSDHGQRIYDDPTNPEVAGHAVSWGGVNVPLMFYVSPSIKEKYPDFIQQLQEAGTRKVMTDILPYAILGMLGIQTKAYDPTLDFLSPHYDKDRPRIVYKGTTPIDVDKELLPLKGRY